MKTCGTCKHWVENNEDSEFGECSVDIPFWAVTEFSRFRQPWSVLKDESMAEECNTYTECTSENHECPDCDGVGCFTGKCKTEKGLETIDHKCSFCKGTGNI